MEEISETEAIRVAENYLAKKDKENQRDLVLVHSSTLEKEYGWVFFYNSLSYLQTGNDEDRLIGNSPFLVEKKGGRIVVLGTAHGVNYYLANYERTGRAHVRPPQPSLLKDIFKWLFRK